METKSLNLGVSLYFFLFCLRFFGRNGLQLWVPVCNLVVVTTAIQLLIFLV